MMTVPTYVAKSTIEGVGIFAAEFIPKGTAIWRCDERLDRVFHEDEIVDLPDHMKDFLNRYGYPHMERAGYVVLEMDNGRFMNHTLDPNTDFTRPDVGYAIADIQPGEEMLCNYFEFDREFTGFGAMPAANGKHPEVHLSNGHGQAHAQGHAQGGSAA